MIERSSRLHFVAGKTIRLRRSVRIIGRPVDAAAPGPESRATHLMRISFGGYWISTGPRRRETATEPRDSKIEATPEEMDRAGFADEAGAKIFENGVTPGEDAPESTHGLG